MFPAVNYLNGVCPLHIMGSVHKKGGMSVRQACGAAVWRPVVMRSSPIAAACEAVLRRFYRQSWFYVRSDFKRNQKNL